MTMLALRTPLLVAATAALLNLLLAAASTSASINSSVRPYPDFQHLNVQEEIATNRATAPQRHQQEEVEEAAEDEDEDQKESKWWRLKLLHRDHLVIPNTTAAASHRHRFSKRMERDSIRVSALIHRLIHQQEQQQHYAVEDFGSDIVSGMEEGSGEYFVRIGVGSPPRSQFMVIDSGSDMVWVQCMPCGPCYPQSDPVFDPSTSASFAGVPCGSSVCRRLDYFRCEAGQCGYQISYRDGSYTTGTLALETLTFGRSVVQNVAIGCGNKNQGMFVGAAGLLGLGSGSMSLVGQLSGQTGGAFSYCLISRGANSSGSLVFGRKTMPTTAAWIPLLRNPRAPIFYYVGFTGLGVGGVRVPISEDVFRLTELGFGGVVMDTGTAITRFPSPAYDALRDAFVGQMGSLPRASPVSIFDTCYDLSGYLAVRVPTVSFYFMGGAILTLPARNFLIPVDEEGRFCFAFAGTESGFSIIGNVQQEGIQISFDEANGFVGFGPNVC